MTPSNCVCVCATPPVIQGVCVTPPYVPPEATADHPSQQRALLFWSPASLFCTLPFGHFSMHLPSVLSPCCYFSLHFRASHSRIASSCVSFLGLPSQRGVEWQTSILGAGGLTPGCGQGHAPSEASGSWSVLASPSCWCSQASLVYGNVTPISVSVFMCLLRLYLCLFTWNSFYKGTDLTGLGARPMTTS